MTGDHFLGVAIRVAVARQVATRMAAAAITSQNPVADSSWQASRTSLRRSSFEGSTTPCARAGARIACAQGIAVALGAGAVVVAVAPGVGTVTEPDG